MRKITLSLLLALVSLTISAAKPVKNVIFMIGDGMGLNQAYSGVMAQGEPLVMMSQADAMALQETWSANKKITDSAASGTALACGEKTKNGMIGMGPDSTEIQSILEKAALNGKSTGIVVTCYLFHATPAAFFAHNVTRKDYEDISRDMLTFSPDIMIGGGRKYMENRKDAFPLAAELQAQGKQLFYSWEALQQSEALQGRPDKQESLIALCADENLPSMTEGRGNYLPEAVATAIDYLSKDKDGFFLMVEGSAIDFRCHASDIDGTVAETIDFDKAVQVAVDFARKDKNTLVVVTADHETGGLSLLQSEDLQPGKSLKHKFNVSGHTGVAVPVYIFGAGAEDYPAFMQNSDHKAIMSKLMKLKK